MPTEILVSLGFSFLITKKNGLHYAQIWHIDTDNLVFEEESLTRQGAIASILNFMQLQMEEIK